MKLKLTLGALILFSAPVCSQVFLQIDTLQEVVINAERTDRSHFDRGLTASSSTEQSVERDPTLNLIRRGAYAQEIVYRGLSSSQVATLVDGMRIYGACTDKMDPASSYVDRSNLGSLRSNRNGSVGFHSLSLDLRQGAFSDGPKWSGNVSTQYHLNNAQTRFAGHTRYDSRRFWWIGNVAYTDAQNYRAGGGQEIRYTQFTKQNAYSAFGWQIRDHEVQGSIIVDRAFDIGYAGLPMDVSSAEAVIGKIEHKSNLGSWKNTNAVYYNEIVHVMDDTKRDGVLMHMDMPGWSSTIGYRGAIERLWEKWLVNFEVELVRNQRFAEMTMYPENEAEMYMQTWPKSVRRFASFQGSFSHYPSESWKLEFKPSIGVFNDAMKEDFGVRQFQVLGYDLEEGITSAAKSIDLKAVYKKQWWTGTWSARVGDRVPELNERFGYYLYNNQDGFDYLGNPELENERTIQVDILDRFEFEKHSIIWTKYAYGFDNYIFGVQDPELWQMMPGGNGVKVYQNIGQAYILGSELEVILFKKSKVPSQLTAAYRYGESEAVGYLPQMLPLELKMHQNTKLKGFELGLSNSYTTDYSRASSAFGERNAKAFWLLDAAISRSFKVGATLLEFEICGNNLLDQHYTTHLNWNGIPQMGRNVSFSLEWSFGETE